MYVWREYRSYVPDYPSGLLSSPTFSVNEIGDSRRERILRDRVFRIDGPPSPIESVVKEHHRETRSSGYIPIVSESTARSTEVSIRRTCCTIDLPQHGQQVHARVVLDRGAKSSLSAGRSNDLIETSRSRSSLAEEEHRADRTALGTPHGGTE